MSICKTWGTTASERKLAYPCDATFPNPQDAYYRGITIEASPETVFRWLCQMQTGTYSYAVFGKTPNPGTGPLPETTPGLDRLERGKRFMDLFVLADFDRNRHITLRAQPAGGLTGEIHVSYLIIPLPIGWSRLLVKVALRYPAGPMGWGMRALLPWGDLLMMRKQLLNFKRYSEAAPGLQHAVEMK